jgi:predicted aldo/keto reductase-like oxidoreductase
VLGRLSVALWIVSIAVGYFVLAGRVGQAAEGMDRGRLSYWPVGIQMLAVGAASLSTLIWALQRASRGSARGGAPLGRLGIARRGFLTASGAVAAGLVATGGAVLARVQGWLFVTGSNIFFAKIEEIDPSPRPTWKGARIVSYRRLGRTEARVSDISLGSGVITEEGGGEALARQAIERGINYFDTSPDYSGASSEVALGRAMAGQREKIFLATKWCTPEGHLPAGSSVQTYVDVVEASLSRLQTSYVDLVHVHACDDIERLSDPNLHEAFARLKQEGKARFLGVSSHTPNLERVADHAIADGRFDVLMLAYHHGAYPRLAEIIDRAAKADLGVVAMKTLKGAKQRSFDVLRDSADSYAQAAFKWVLSNPSVSCLVISFWEQRQLDEYLFASGRAPTTTDLALLRRYDELIAGTHCFAHCGACLDSCPENLAINDVLRHRMYFEDYGQQKYAMSLYAKLEKQADVCIGCAAPCVGTCPHGVPIQERTTGAHRLLTLV